MGAQLEAGERERIEQDIAALRQIARKTGDLDELHRRLTAFGHRTLRLAELGIRDALVESKEPKK